MTASGTIQSTPGEARPGFASWAILEAMGFKKLAGFVQEETIAGAALLRIDVPPTTKRTGYTKYFGPTSIYCLTPTSEDIARRAAEEIEAWTDPIPVSLPRQLPATTATARVSTEAAAAELSDDLEHPEDVEEDDLPFSVGDVGEADTFPIDMPARPEPDDRLTRSETYDLVTRAVHEIAAGPVRLATLEVIRRTAIAKLGHESRTLSGVQFETVLVDMEKDGLLALVRRDGDLMVDLTPSADPTVDVGPASLAGVPMDAGRPA